MSARVEPVLFVTPEVHPVVRRAYQKIQAGPTRNLRTMAACA